MIFPTKIKCFSKFDGRISYSLYSRSHAPGPAADFFKARIVSQVTFAVASNLNAPPMSHIPYPFEQVQPTRYKFFSLGRNRIEKIVDFVPLKPKNLMNLGFGDLLPDGSIDDKITSNNGDIAKVLATVVMILKHFTAKNSQLIIYFRGSTDERTRLYTRILKMYYNAFSKEFLIYGITGTEQNSRKLPFDPRAQIDYFAFLIKRF